MATPLKHGDRVKRGPDWKWDNQDEGGLGTVVLPEDGLDINGYVWVSVLWDKGGCEESYRYGEKVRDIVLATTSVVRNSKFPHANGCPRCGADAYVGLNLIDCSAGCR